MIVGSTFSGIGGIDLGLERAGHTVAWSCEIDDWCRRLLGERFPGATCYGDIRAVDSGVGLVDLLCGGFPCQDLSVAGRRAGLAGERSGLFFEFARVADAVVRPGGWILIENVPGLLSSDGGRDFAIVLATLADLGFHDLAWRVLDSRYFGVPQRRRRIFILARRASGDRAQQVLLEPESGGGDFATSREAGARPAAVSALSTTRGGGHGLNAEKAAGGQLIEQPARALTAHPGGRYDQDTETFVVDQAAPLQSAKHGLRLDADEAQNLVPHYYVEDFEDGTLTSSTGRTDRHPLVVAETLTAGSHPGSNMPGRRREDDVNLVPFEQETVPTLMFGSSRDDPCGLRPGFSGDGHVVAVHENQRGEVTTPDTMGSLKVGGGKPGQGYPAVAFDWTQDDHAPDGRDYSPPVRGSTGHQPPAVHENQGVRRLTPTECERLQGFPDGWTAIDGEATPDSRRYAACGNAVTVNVAEWIGRRLARFG